jgi:hypothetical protein
LGGYRSCEDTRPIQLIFGTTASTSSASSRPAVRNCLERPTFKTDEVDMEETMISELQPYLEATIVGRLGAVSRSVSGTRVWLLDDDKAGFSHHPGSIDEVPRVHLELGAGHFDLVPGLKVRATGIVEPVGRSSLRMVRPEIELLHTPMSVAILRSSPCEACGRDGTWILDWMGLRGEGFHVIDGKAEPCSSCEGAGFRFFDGSGWFAIRRSLAVLALGAAVGLGWVLGR